MSYIMYFIILILTIITYSHFCKKTFSSKNLLQRTTEIFFLITITTYLFILLIPNGYNLYDLTYLKSIFLNLSLTLLFFSYGLIQNKKAIYQTNLMIYIFLYILLLISVTFIIGRPNISINFNSLKYIDLDITNTIPSLIRYFQPHVSFKKRFYNIYGNIFMLIPLSFLLMLKDSKYFSLKKQISIILPIILGIEFTQALTNTGSFDIDDIFLNLSGVILFTLLFTKTKLINKCIPYFFSAHKLKKMPMIFYVFIYLISLIYPSYFIVKTLFITITTLI